MPFKNRKERRELGLCCQCSRKAEPGRSYCLTHLEKQRARGYRPPKNQDTYKRWYYPRKYGITYEDYLIMLEKQAHGCAVCGRTEPRNGTKALHVDHNHRTGKVRGLLCNDCNRAIGLLKDDPDLASRLATYLKETN